MIASRFGVWIGSRDSAGWSSGRPARTSPLRATNRGYGRGVIVAFSISPAVSDETGGVSEAVAAAIRVVRESGLPNETEGVVADGGGEWDEVMAGVERAVDVVAERSPRVSLVLKADIRPGHTGELTGKVQRVNDLL